MLSTGALESTTPRGLVELFRQRAAGPLGLPSLFRVHAASRPDALAIVDDDGAVSWRELDARIDRLAAGLREIVGLQAGDAAVLVSHNRREIIEAQAALARLGAAAVAVSWRSTPDELEYLVEHSGAKAIFVDVDAMDAVAEARPRLSRVDDRYVVIGGDGPFGHAYDDLLTTEPGPRLDGREGRVVIYTSGTTGKPKGAVREFPPEMMWAVLHVLDELPLRHDDRHLAVCPMYHSTAFGFIGFTLVLGGTVVIERRFDPERFLAAVERHRITTTAIVPTMLHRVLDLPDATLSDYDGAPVWDRSAGADALPGSGWLAVADLDLDGSPEIVIVGGGHFIRAVDGATGADVWGPIDINPPELAADVAANGNPNGGGPPTIANFDDDPNPEIAFAGGFAYVIFGHDGSRQWYYTTQDRSSRSTGSSIFDFEGDGVAEVLYNDEIRFRVFRGPDGSVLHDECNTSGTLREFPIVVDVDNDDQAEIVVMENDYASGLTCTGEPNGHGIHVFQHPRGQWVRTRRIFNQHTYHVTNIEEDGTVPVRETPNWSVPSLNNFRQNVQPDGLFDAPDAVLADLFAVTSRCPTEIGLSVRVVNRGAAGMPAGIPVTFYRDEAGTRTLLGRAFTTRALLPGESEVVVLDTPFAIPAGMDGATFTFVAVVNDPDDMPVPTFNQCRTENDTSELLEASCPIIE